MNPPSTSGMPRRIIVAITGASGSIFGIRALEALQETDIETHLVVSKWGGRTLVHETTYTLGQVREMADVSYAPGDQGAPISSGSFVTEGMLVAPCSARTLGAIANGLGEHLVHRAADVVLKERRTLVLAVRESPFNQIHLENMLRLSRMGVVICPPLPGFYNHPQSLEELVDHTVNRLLDQFGVHLDLMPRWSGRMRLRDNIPSEP